MRVGDWMVLGHRDDISRAGVPENLCPLIGVELFGVAGFDDGLLSQYLDPPLTTVRAPIKEVGRSAAEQLLRLIRTGQAEPLTLLPTELVIRRSCGCC